MKTFLCSVLMLTVVSCVTTRSESPRPEAPPPAPPPPAATQPAASETAPSVTEPGGEATTRPEDPPAPEPAPAETETRQESAVVSAEDWKLVTRGPATVVACSTVQPFEGDYVCRAAPGPSCPTSVTPTDKAGPVVCESRGGRSAWTGSAPAGVDTYLCCGTNKGRGGELRVTYTKTRQ